jgi:hypothetical protein
LVCALWATAAAAQAPRDPHALKPGEVTTWTVTGPEGVHEVHPATTSDGGDTGLVHLPSADTLGRGLLSFGLYRDDRDRDPKDLDIATFGVSVGYGVTKRLEAFASFGLQRRVDADALFQPGFANEAPFVTTPWQTGIGDLGLGAKLGLLEQHGASPLRLAARAVVTLPTADETKGLGTGKASFIADLVATKDLNHLADVHALLGYRVSGDPAGRDLANAVRWGLGLSVPSYRRVQLQVEVTGTAYHGGEGDQTSPVDVVIGPVLWLGRGFFARADITWNSNFDDRGLGSSFWSRSDYLVSIGYHPGTLGRAVQAPRRVGER